MVSIRNIYFKTKHIVLYSGLMAVLVFALKWLEWKLLIAGNAMEIYIGLIALAFTILGIWVSNQLARPKVKTIVVEKEIYLNPSEDEGINQAELEKLGLSTREYEVLQLLMKGYSNAEIGEHLFLSLSTVKTHVSTMFVKMDVKSRLQAIEKAKRLKIVA